MSGCYLPPDKSSGTLGSRLSVELTVTNGGWENTGMTREIELCRAADGGNAVTGRAAAW
jgi:hypothetical protein